MFVPPCAATYVRVASNPTGRASTISSVLNEGLKYFMTSGVAIRALRQTNACCCSGLNPFSILVCQLTNWSGNRCPS